MDFRYGIDHLTSGIALKISRRKVKGIFTVEARTLVEQCAQRVQSITLSDEPVYGINTGFGPLCTTIIQKEELNHLQENILRSHSVGVGKSLSTETSRLMIILKVHSLCKGYSGIRPLVIDRLLWMLEAGITPIVPSKGSVGASGDLAPLAHLFLPLIGEGEVEFNDELKPIMEVLQLFNLGPLELAPKEGLALINGTQFILAHAVQLIEQFHHILTYADISGAIMVEALKGSASPFMPDLHRLRPFKGNQHVADRLWTLIKDSEINCSHVSCGKVQDPYSLRCIPQVHGASRDSWLHLKERVEVELNSVTDNPIILPDGTTVSGGNFHGQPLAISIDYATVAISEIGNISDRRIYLSIMGNEEGVPTLLLKETGVNSGFMILQYTSAALASENKSLCFPASADSIPTSLGQEDHVSMGSISSRKALEVAENVKDILAIELLCAVQALDYADPLKPHPILSGLHQLIRKHVKYADEDRYFGKDIKRVKSLIDQSVIINYIEENDQYEDIRTPYNDLFEVY